MEEPVFERFVLIFDFETTGLPKDSWSDYQIVSTYDSNGNYIQQSNEKNYPYAIQLSYILYDNLTNKAKIKNDIIRLPEGIEITPESLSIHNISLNITQEKTRKVKSRKTRKINYDYNFTIDKVLSSFMKDFNKADIIVSHNVQFDKNMLLVEMDRLRNKKDTKYNIFNQYINDIYYSTKFFCTAKAGCYVWNKIGINRFGENYLKTPKLSVLYQTLFGFQPNENILHNALYDVVICMRCFYMIRYNVDINDYNSKISILIKDIDKI